MIFAATALAERVFLVTGASSGIGRSAAGLIAQCGGRVIATGRDGERLQATVQALAGSGHRALAGSLADAEQAATLVGEAAAAEGGLDGIFHAAGSELTLPVRLTRQKQIDEVLGAALNGAIGVARAAGKTSALKSNGSIVFMSSVAATRGRPGMVLYSAAKAGVEGLTRSLACELAPKAIRVNAIAAGGVRTEMHERLTRNLSEAAIGEYERAHPMGFGAPGDVAAAAVFLLSAAAAWITGTVLTVDGGYSAG